MHSYESIRQAGHIPAGRRLKICALLVCISCVLALGQWARAAIDTLPTQFNKKAEYKTHGSYATDLFSGSATFDYPIVVCPGRRGLQPKFSLGYSSGGSAEWPGLGWRIPVTLVERDINYTPDDTSDDFFRIQSNGGRFELVYNPATGRYHSEIESFMWIEKRSGGDTGQDYWLVKAPNGNVMECGKTSDSLLAVTTPGSTSFVALWCINRIEDPYGNTMTYRYAQPGAGQIYLNEVAYSNEEARQVLFTNETRPEAATISYRGGYAHVLGSRLADIEVRFDGSLVRRYDLSYGVSASSNRSLLAAITETGDDGVTTLPATRFSYVSAEEALGDFQTKKASYAVATGEQEQADGTFVSGGDFNGDSFTDILLYRTQGDAYDWEVLLTSRDGFGEFTTWKDSTPVNNSNTHKALGNFTMVANFDQDGRSDVLYYDASADGGTVKVMTSTGSGFSDFAIWNTGFAIPNTQAQKDLGNSLRAGDFNGDGRTDLFLYQAHDASYDWKVALSSGTTLLAWQAWRASTQLPLTSSQRSSGNKLFFGDFNGDGLTDVCLYQAHDASYDWKVAFSTGAGFTEMTRWKRYYPIAATASDNESYGSLVTTGEFNADGKVDILFYDGRPGARDWKVMYSTGSGFQDWVVWKNDLFIDNSPETLQQGSFFLGGDFSAVGRTQFLIYRHRAGAYDWRVISPQGRDVDQLKTVHEELGGRIDITYGTTNDFDNLGEDGLPGLPFSRAVVTKVVDTNGMSGEHLSTTTLSYEYEGGLYDFERREFVGFRRVRVTDADGHYVDSYYHQDVARKGKAYRVATYAAGGALYEKTDTTWAAATLASPPGRRSIVFPYVVREEKTTYDGNGSCRMMVAESPADYIEGSTYEYGKPAWTKSYGTRTPLVEQRFEFSSDTTNWILGLVTHEETRDLGGTIRAQNWAEYNTQGDVTKRIAWVQNLKTDPKNPVTRFEYDGYGNVVRRISPEGHETLTTYDSTYHTFAETVEKGAEQTDVEHLTARTYEYGTGQVLTVTDPNNNTKTNTYDTFHRLIQVEDPHGGKVYHEYERDGVAPEHDVVRRQEEYGSGGTLDSSTYYDGFGRTIQTKAEGESGQWITVDLFYDLRGLTRAFSNPHFTASSDYTAPQTSQPRTTAAYDALERVTAITFPDGTSRSMDYDDWHTIHTDARGNQVEALKDGRGNLVQVTEHKGAEKYLTQYTYDTLGNLVGIVDAHGNAWDLTYDPLGRRTAMDDPDMGEWQYSYNREGKVVSQTDAKAQTIQFEYDELNRLTRKKTPSRTLAENTYDQGTNGIGRLSRSMYISDDLSSGSSEYAYDKLGRRIGETKRIAGCDTAFATSYEYDALNRLVSLTYPDGEEVAQTYNAQGQLDSVESGLRTYISSIAYNAANQPTAMAMGNTVQTDFTYDPQMQRLATVRTYKPGSGDLQNFTYDYDPVGNISEVADTAHTGSAEYEYDALNRLTQATGVGWQQQFAYNAIGNMVQFVDEGGTTHYRAYGFGAGPHALTGERGAAVEMVSLILSGEGNGSVSVDGELHGLPWSNQVTRNQVVNLDAVADTSWAFLEWQGDMTGSVDPTAITMSATKAVTAKFTSRGTGDFDGDEQTGISDWLFLLDHWQQQFDGHAVGAADFLALLDNWGTSRDLVLAAGATSPSICLTPASAALGVKDTIEVELRVDTGGQAVLGGAAVVLHDTAAFEVVSVAAATGSPFELSPPPQSGKGRVEICFLAKGFSPVACDGPVAIITLKALQTVGATHLTYETVTTRLAPAAGDVVREGATYFIHRQEPTSARKWTTYR